MPVRALSLVAALLVACAPTDGDDTDTDTDAADTDDAPLDVAACLRDPTCDHVLIVAHRGFHRDVPENSLAAVHATAALGAHLAEVDVRVTADGHLVVMHDDTVDRTTDGTGAVEALTLAQIEALTLDGGTDPASSRVPTFAAVLDAAVADGLGVYVDTKTSRVDLVAAAIVAAGAEDLALVRRDASDLAPALDAGLLVIAPVDEVAAVDGLAASLPDHAFLEVAKAPVDADLAAAILGAGRRVQQDVFFGDGPWALAGSVEGWEDYLASGVQMPQSEYPDGLVESLRSGTLPSQVP